MIMESIKDLRKPELLVPAGSPEALRTAILYGADAVYIGGTNYGLRARAANFDRDTMRESVAYAHAHGVRVHVTVNIIAHEDQLDGLEDYLLFLQSISVDALIVADAGILSIARGVIPDMEIHLSTQASATNSRTMSFWHKQGVKRIVAAREVSLDQLARIRSKVDPDLDIEAFVHGAMCMSISGRCLLSNYLAGRDANQGACVHPCRWKYHLVEETRPGEYMPVFEGEEGTYIMNSKDLCMIEYLPQMIQAGVISFKIEGRMKTPLYVAMTAKAYREAIDDLFEDPALYEKKKPYYKELLSMVSHRDYSTGFYLGDPDQNSYNYTSAEYQKSAVFVGKVLSVGKDQTLVEQRNKFSVGDTVYLLAPKGEPIPVTVSSITDEEGKAQESAPHARQKVFVSLPQQATEGMILMKQMN